MGAHAGKKHPIQMCSVSANKPWAYSQQWSDPFLTLSCEGPPSFAWGPCDLEPLHEMLLACFLCFQIVAAAFFSIFAGSLSVSLLTRHPQAKWAAAEFGSFPKESKVKKDPCQATWRQRLHDHLHRIVLIVNYNYAEHARESAALLRSLHSPFFDKLILIAPTALQELGVEARTPNFMLGSKWYWSYAALQRIIRENPDAEGFLWMSDDVALNYWHLAKANKTKVWVKRYRGMNFPFNSRAKSKSRDYAGGRQHRVSAWTAFRQMEKPFQQQFHRSMAPRKYMFPKRVVDVMYLPRNHSHTFAEKLIPIFLRNKVWWEIAVPMMLFSVQHPLEYDGVLDSMEYRWEHRGKNKEDYDALKFWSPQVSGLHPWKLSTIQSRVRYLKALGKVDRCVDRMRDLVNNSTVTQR